jgi:type II secretory pathway component PulF
MALFDYSAMVQGVRRRGTLTAESQAQAVATLRAEGALVLMIRTAAPPRLPPVDFGRFLIRRASVELVFRQLSSLLRAGVPILSALHSLAETSPRVLAAVLRRIAESVRNGHSFSKALMAQMPGLDPATRGLLEIGEANGSLDTMAAYAADLMERSRKIRADILQALGYPLLVLLAGLGLGYYMVNEVFPVLMEFIKQGRSVELPLPTRMLIWLNDFLLAYGGYVLAAPAVVLVGLILLRRNARTGPIMDAIGLHLPLFGGAIRFYSNAMWCLVLGSMLSSGLDVLAAVELVEKTMGNAHYRAQFGKIRGLLRQGGSMSQCLSQTDLKRLCPMSCSLAAVSEESGLLDEGLLQVAAFSEEQMKRRVALLCKMIEPTVFAVIGGFVGVIYFGFFMAVYAAAGSVL